MTIDRGDAWRSGIRKLPHRQARLPLYEKAWSHWPLERFAQDAKNALCPKCPGIAPMLLSEHPWSPAPQGAEFTARVLDALTENPKTWGETVLFLTFR